MRQLALHESSRVLKDTTPTPQAQIRLLPPNP